MMLQTPQGDEAADGAGGGGQKVQGAGGAGR